MQGQPVTVPRIRDGPECIADSGRCVFQIGVSDVDAAYDRAVGATPTLPLTNMFWGDLYAWVRDPFGQMWALCETREVLTSDQIAERMQSDFGTEASALG